MLFSLIPEAVTSATRASMLATPRERRNCLFGFGFDFDEEWLGLMTVPRSRSRVSGLGMPRSARAGMDGVLQCGGPEE